MPQDPRKPFEGITMVGCMFTRISEDVLRTIERVAPHAAIMEAAGVESLVVKELCKLQKPDWVAYLRNIAESEQEPLLRELQDAEMKCRIYTMARNELKR